MSYLIETGRWSGRIRTNLREFLAAQPNQNEFVNNLIERALVKELIEKHKTKEQQVSK